ncbi:transcriptional regulator, LysR family [Octadecabacter temperatus]|uniref:HTH-type transcriptional regulator CysL n=1 Tax=Octadecabacter temperatus TaxID=1458307 RepID=A0A0K0Y8J3_9RHOB|nr:LysR family transcriptional regulator [Octadecabacter temperatus]AKS47289.1 HTH-type transcriptional regulator CysL [Octadecabacter temperatus]SIO44387.1 transcriptional regulator, LysR family [Octadecabacter temperatus]
MDNWDEIRTAFQVANIGTVSGAADALGVHHATVIRHIDTLESRLGVKLFQRHPRGYTATEAGQDLMQVAAATDDQFTQLAGRIRGQGEGVSGDLVVTSLVFFSPFLTPVLAKFRRKHPELTVRFLTGERVFRLEYGEAHVAIRAGVVPDQPDNVVQPFFKHAMHLVAAPSYVEEYGLPNGIDDLSNHWFVGHESDESRAPFNRWLINQVGPNRIVHRATDFRAITDAVLAGAGVGFVDSWTLRNNPDLIEVVPSLEEWSGDSWLVTHVDLHRTTKVQTFLKFLKEEAATWQA